MPRKGMKFPGTIAEVLGECYTLPGNGGWNMHQDRKDLPIGIFDSGVGGISVLGEIAGLMPHEKLWYYGDTAYAPYGTKPVEAVLNRSMEIVRNMLDLPVKAIVIACNTASSIAAPEIRASIDLPVIAMEPALKPASMMRHGGRILVLATPNTLKLPKFQRLYELYGEGAIPVPCPGLMELVEEGRDDLARDYLKDLFARYEPGVDAVVLGCTHYVFLKKMATELLPEGTMVVDGNLGTARQLKRVLEANGLLRQEGGGSVTFHTSSYVTDEKDGENREDPKVLSLMDSLFRRAREGL